MTAVGALEIKFGKGPHGKSVESYDAMSGTGLKGQY
jgi:hypothetical protein